MWSHSRRYPLLLSRVYKNTSESDPNRSLREAKHRFEELLEHINNASPSLTHIMLNIAPHSLAFFSHRKPS